MKIFIGELANTWKFHGTVEETHERVAKFAAKLMNAFHDRNIGEYPTQMNSNHHTWYIDANNDWFLIFSEDAPYEFEFRHRYATDENEQVRKALTEWFAYRIGGCTVKEIGR